MFADVKDNVKSFGLFLYIVLELIQGLTESNGCAVVGCGHEQWLIADAIIALTLTSVKAQYDKSCLSVVIRPAYVAPQIE